MRVKNNDVVGFSNLIESKLCDVVSADISESLLASVELNGEFASSCLRLACSGNVEVSLGTHGRSSWNVG